MWLSTRSPRMPAMENQFRASKFNTQLLDDLHSSSFS